MATDQERIVTLLGQGFSAQAIAAILDTDLTTVHGLSVGSGNLPSAGGGSGLVVGAWESIDFSGVPTFPASDPFVLPALDVPNEVEVVYAPTANTSGAFTIESADDPGVAVYALSATSWGDVTYGLPFRAIVPAAVPIQVRALFGGGAWVVQNINRRTLG